MAPVVKRLRPRIVVPICMGSNPIRRPIKYSVAFATEYFIQRSLQGCRTQRGKAEQWVRRISVRIERSEIRIARKLSKLEPQVLLRNFSSVEEIQEKSHQAPHFKTSKEVFFNVCKWEENPYKTNPCQWVRMLRRYLVSETNLGTTDTECEFVA